MLLFFENRIHRLAVAGIVPLAVVKVHVLAVGGCVMVNAVQLEPSVLTSTVSPLLVSVLNNPNCSTSEVWPSVLMPEMMKSRALLVAVPMKTLSLPLAPV